jgi:eukaryotic-like serine/threonine-protein kinase
VKKAGEAPGKTTVAEAWYDFACGAAMAGHRDEAFQYLREAFDHGYHDADHMAKDDDLKSLRNDSRFTGLIQELRLRGGKVQ